MTPELQFRPVDKDTWKDLTRLFEERGGPKSCWCMVWRASTKESKVRDGASRRMQLESRVQKQVPVGLLGYLHDCPAAWCSIAPRETYRKLGGSEPRSDDRIWSLACMFVKRDFRRTGLVSQIIQAAVAHARANGATIVEAYPVDSDSPSFRFMGFVDTFAAAGIDEVGRAGKRRHVMRFEV